MAIIGFILDPLEALQVSMDTSLLMIKELNSRGHKVLYTTIDTLYLDGRSAVARWREISYSDSNQNLLESQGDFHFAPLSDLDLVHMRKDPPFDSVYLSVLYILDYANTLVINSPAGIREVSEKLSIYKWPDIGPYSFISKDHRALLQKMKQQGGEWVVKPLFEHGGSGIFKLDEDDENWLPILNLATKGQKEFVILQRYCPSESNEDKRIFLVNGLPIGWMGRIPNEGEFRANIHLGATPVRCELTDSDLRIVECVSPMLIEKELPYACIDVIDGALIEINVTSPSGIPEINKVMGEKLECQLVDHCLSYL